MYLDVGQKEKRDVTMMNIALLVEAAIEKLAGSSLPRKNGVFVLENFEVSVKRSQFNREGAEFNFWRKGKKAELTARLTEDGRTFMLFMKERRVLLEDAPILRIEEHVNEKLGYPHFESIWNGEGNEVMAKGVLQFFRVDLSEKLFVNYYYARGSRYNADNHTDKELPELGLPRDLNEVSSVLGQPVLKMIDFDAKKKEILDMSELEKLCREINDLTGKI